MQWNLKDLKNSPQTWVREDLSENNCKALFFEGLPYKGKSTRVFAFLGLPEKANYEKVPGMVLVHGGGGTAFSGWVQQWVQRGYAAIAIDTCGCIPGGNHNNRPRHEWAGPVGCGGFETLLEPKEDHWIYHAVGAIIKAKSIIEVQPEIDKSKIGIIGISWGGFLTSICASIDSSFTAAISIYGCGYVGRYQNWPQELLRLPQEQQDIWENVYDASNYLSHLEIPMLWINSTADKAFPLPAWSKSQELTNGPIWRCIHRDLIHSNETAQDVEESFAFMDNHLCNRDPIPRCTNQNVDKRFISTQFNHEGLLRRAFLLCSGFNEQWRLRRWSLQPANLKSGQVHARIPDFADIAYISCVDSNGMISSGPLWMQNSIT